MKKKLSTSTVVAVIAVVVLVSALLIWKGVSTQNDKGVVKPMDMMKQGAINPQDAQNAYLRWKQTGKTK